MKESTKRFTKAMAKEGWVQYHNGDPLPKGLVRIYDEWGWASGSYLLAKEWSGWCKSQSKSVPCIIIAYMPREPQ